MKRPTGITILALIAAIGGICVIVLSGVIPLPGLEVATGSEAWLIGAGLLVGGILSVVFGIGAWLTQRWAWAMGILGSAVLLVASVASLWRDIILPGTFIGVIVAAGVLSLLIRPQVRRAFALASSPPPAPSAPVTAPSQKQNSATRRRPRRR